MNNIFTNKKIYEMLGKSKGPGKLTDLSGDGKVTQKDVLIGRGVLPEPPESGGLPKTIKEKKGKKERLKSSEGETSAEAKKRRATNKQNRKDSRRQKTTEKIENAKNATKGKKSNNVEGNSQVVKKSNKAKRLEERLKRQEGRAERKKIRKADLSRGDKRKQIIDSRKKQKAKNTVVKKPKTEITKQESKKTINTKFKGGKIGDKDGDGKIDVNLVKDSKKSNELLTVRQIAAAKAKGSAK